MRGSRYVLDYGEPVTDACVWTTEEGHKIAPYARDIVDLIFGLGFVLA